MSTTTPTLTTTISPTIRRRRRVAALVAALVIGSLGSACSSGDAATAETEPTAASAAATTVDATPATTEAPDTATPDAEPAEHLVVRSDQDVEVHEAPDGAVASTIPAVNDFGSPLALLVLDQEPGWLQVLLPGRPTGATGWVATDAVELRQVTTEVHVDLAARRLTLVEDGETVLETPVAVGAPDAPTPTGRFSITDKIASTDPGGAYGPYALGLSGRSEVLTEFAGGDGQIGIHGTNDPSSIGDDVSHGCIRVPNDVIEQLEARLPLGTPVVVS